MIFGSKVSLSAAFWLDVIINFTALVVTYYSVFFIMRNLYQRFDFTKYETLSLGGQIFYWFKVEFIAIIALVIAYIVLLIGYDRILGYNYPDVLSHIDRRFTRVLPYIMFSCVNSFIAWYRKRQKQLAIVNKMRYKKLEEDTRQIRELYRKLNELRTLN